jgi:hypothetical protein
MQSCWFVRLFVCFFFLWLCITHVHCSQTYTDRQTRGAISFTCIDFIVRSAVNFFLYLPFLSGKGKVNIYWNRDSGRGRCTLFYNARMKKNTAFETRKFVQKEVEKRWSYSGVDFWGCKSFLRLMKTALCFVYYSHVHCSGSKDSGREISSNTLRGVIWGRRDLIYCGYTRWWLHSRIPLMYVIYFVLNMGWAPSTSQ